MVRRVQDPVNRRRYILYLTEKGENIIPEILDAEKKWEDTIFKDFSEEERSFLVDV
jgi:DNA-binding MarR family transcriptional regulator